MTTHQYETSLNWEGRTDNYETYGREHQVAIAATDMTMSAGAEFRGDLSLPNPEQLIVAAASSCQLLSFLALAALRGIEVLSYSDSALGEMRSGARPMRLARIVLNPHIVVTGSTVEQVGKVLDDAHEQCYIANSLVTEVLIEPVVEVV